MAPRSKPLRTRPGNKANRVPDELRLAMLHLADLCGRLEDGWTFPDRGPLRKRTTSAAKELVAALAAETDAEVNRRCSDLAGELAPIYAQDGLLSDAVKTERIDDVFARFGYHLPPSALKLAVHPPRRSREKGPKECAMEVVEGLLPVSVRTLYTLQKATPLPWRVDPNAGAHRRLLAFVRALRWGTRSTQHSGLRSIEALVLARLRRRESRR